ncbi:MAG: TonB-dependent receptor plug [Bacteroidetes bacterium]|nr:TonB-dependent receptor plug [Bacteroidota bacterium]
MKRKIFFLTVLLLFGVYFVSAQQNLSVSGVVTDASDGSPLLGVSVQVKGTSTGTVTDLDGKYSINVHQGSVLVFSYIGMEKQEISVKSRIVNVKMQPDAKMLDEVVAVGYGTMKKSDLSGASVTVGEDKLKGSIITNMDQALQGRVAGVTAVQTSGAPGSSVSIRVRGQSTINADAEPLYVIDGVPVQIQGRSGADFGLGDALGNGAVSTVSPLSTINPSDIVSMEILKDASATAIYGSQASNGVVLITTKRGKVGEAKFTYEGMFGFQRQAKRLDVMNLKEFAEYSNDMAAETAGRDIRVEFRDPSLLGVGTNWQDAVFQSAPMHSHTVSASGGNEFMKYYVSGSYLNQEGTVIGTKFERFSFKSNLDAQLKKWLKMGVNLSYSSTDERLGLADSDEGIINIALLSTPDVPIKDIDGNYTSVNREGVATRINPIAKALDEDNLLSRSNLSGNIYFDATLYKNLIWHTEYAINKSGSDAERFRPTATYGSWSRSINSDTKQHNQSTFWQIKNYLNYSKDFGLHKTTAMIGNEIQESSWEYQSISASNLPDNTIHNPSLGSDPLITSGFGSSSMASVFARGTYNYNDKYYATYTFRYDGSSNFGPLNRWAPFHAAAASWRLSNENFMADFKPVISNAKLRLGWGQTGNQAIDGYRWGASISSMETGLGAGYRQSNIANPYIKWETQEQVNLGLDLALLDNRIELNVDAYRKISKDMLMQMDLPSYMGTDGNVSSALAAPWGNYGSIENKGLEFSLNTHNIKTADFQWDSELQVSFNKNKLLALDGTSSTSIEGYGQWTDVVSHTVVGQSLYNFYGYVVEGIYQDKEDIENSATPDHNPTDGVSYSRTNTVYPGDIKYKDVDGNGYIDENDRTNLGSPLPKFTFGLNNTIRYKNFDLNIFVNGSYGNKVLNYSSINLTSMETLWNNQLAVVTERARLTQIDASISYPRTNSTGTIVYNWYDDIDNVKVANSGAKLPRAIQNDPNDNARISSRYIEDGSYLRIKNIALGYNFNKKLLKPLHLETLRIYANIQNLYTLTKYSGFDPEIGSSTASSNVMGLDNGRYPSPQVYSFGLNLSF